MLANYFVSVVSSLCGHILAYFIGQFFELANNVLDEISIGLQHLVSVALISLQSRYIQGTLITNFCL